METTNQKLNEISKIVCKYFEFDFDKFQKFESGKNPLPKLRQIVCLLAKKHLVVSYRELAEFLNKKNHSTIYLTVKGLKDRMEFDKSLNKEISEIELIIMDAGLSKKSYQVNSWYDFIDLNNCIVFRQNNQSILFSNYNIERVKEIVEQFKVGNDYLLKQYNNTNTFIYKSNKNESN